jgi:pimeloyl-ACP methyl ester carboxylesterase
VFACSIVETPRLSMNVWTSGPEDGAPVLLVHGNLTTGGFWKYVAAELPDDVRVIAPDMRGFGLTDAAPIDATRGLGDMSDDVHGLLETLGLAGARRVTAAGWSMGGGILQQLLLEHPEDLGALVLVAPISPYGFGGTTDAAGKPAFADSAGSGGGGAAPEFVRRMREKDRSVEDPSSSPRVVLRSFFGAGANAANVDEEFLLSEALTTRIGDDFYPGDSRTSENWPTLAPGDRGVLNTMSPNHYDASAIAESSAGIPITWVHGSEDQVCSDRSMFDFGTLGEMGAVPGWPGADALPPQPMKQQTRAMLDGYAAQPGQQDLVREVELEGIAHGLPLEVPGTLAEEIMALVRR